MKALVTSMLALGALVAAAGLAAGATQVDAVDSVTFDEGGLADGYDYDYRWNGGGWTQLSRSGVGTLSTSMTGAGAINTSGLKLLKTICLKLDNGDTQGRQCWKKYAPTNGDSDPNYKYRLYWVKGSGTAKNGRKLTRIRAQVISMTDGMYIADWSPTGTKDIGSCQTDNVGLSASFKGFSISIGSSFTTCPETFGLDYLGNRQFRIKWAGKRAAGSWIGVGGGALYAVPESKGATAKFWMEHVTCSC
jgi:hypothetical protein